MISTHIKVRNLDSGKLEKVSTILKSISHPIRLRIIMLLELYEEMTVSEILSHLPVEQSVLSHHLTRMKDRGVLRSNRKGRNIRYSLALPEILKILDCMENCDL